MFKNKITKSPVSRHKTNYTCADSTLESVIRYYLNGERSFKECLEGILEYMAYNDWLHIRENDIIFDLLEDFVDGKEHFSIKVRATKKQEIIGTTWLCANEEMYDSMEDAKKALKKLQKNAERLYSNCCKFLNNGTVKCPLTDCMKV